MMERCQFVSFVKAAEDDYNLGGDRSCTLIINDYITGQSFWI